MWSNKYPMFVGNTLNAHSKEYTSVTDLIFLFRTAVYIPYFFQQGFMAQVLGMGHKPKQKIQNSMT